MSNDPRETLKLAADAARMLLPKWERRKASAEQQIAHLKAIIAASDGESGKRPAQPHPTTADIIARIRHRRGQVMQHVDTVLDGGQRLDENMIRAEIERRFQVLYARSSLHAALDRGRRGGRYDSVNGKWGKVT